MDPINLKLEGGKRITLQVHPSSYRVALVVWRKNGSPLLPLELTPGEAQELRDQLTAAISAA